MKGRTRHDRMVGRAAVRSCRLAVLALFFGGGCLFVDKVEPVNKRPEARIDLLTHEPYHVGTQVIVSAEESLDPDGRIVRYDWIVEYDVAQQEAFEDCGPGFSVCGLGGEATCCFVPKAKTVFTIRLRTADERGLISPWEERTVVVSDRPPNAVLTRETVPNDRGHYTVGQRVWFHALRTSRSNQLF